ncbi:DEDD exonuclease domain-containing protein [Luteimicrobium subarcticum]|nr:DEDD exonuclease domain-containing protein [Luteimicrobium subarcticum]
MPMVPTSYQPTLDDLGTPLADVTFVVVDLETTGAAVGDSGITEIGAVKVRGGEILGEFQTLVDPGRPVPAFIARLTGITTAMVQGAPRIEAVLPAFLEFARGSVLVAHNAPFDVGFLKAAARAHGYAWPGFQVVDTVPLARRVVTREEAPNHKLSTLAALFRATVTPEHRALADARATVDVLHALLERHAAFGVTHLEDLANATDPVPVEVRRKRHLADGLPEGPGVYLFHAPDGEVLYVGTSTNVRKRVRQYFTAAEKRRRITEMVRIASSVSVVPCGTTLEAQVRELRLIAQHEPRYNRRSRHPERMTWVRLTSEPFPRLSVVREVRPESDGRTEAHVGPFASRSQALAAVDAVHEALPLRQCARRLPATAGPGASSCVLLDLGRCAGPCVDTGSAVRAEYDAVVGRVRDALVVDPSPVVDALSERLAVLSADERYEQAQDVAARLEAFLAGAHRTVRVGALARCRELVAARPVPGGWELVVVRHARLAATCTTRPGEDPVRAVRTLVAVAEHVDAPHAPAPACHPHEAEIVLAWLDQADVRLVEVTDPLSCPVGAGSPDRHLARAAVRVAAYDRADRNEPSQTSETAPC